MAQVGTSMTSAGVTQPTHIDWTSAIWAGLIAGAAMMMIEMPLMALAGMGFWAPPRMIAAIVLGREVLPPPATFSIGVMAVAMMIHLVLSIVYAFIFAWVISRWELGTGMALVAGGVFGLVLYVVNFYGFTVLFPWFADARGWISIISHMMFGIVLGGTYVALLERNARTTVQSRGDER